MAEIIKEPIEVIEEYTPEPTPLDIAKAKGEQRRALLKAGQIATRDLIKSDSLTEDEIKEIKSIYPLWKPDIDVAAGELYLHNDSLHEVIQSHKTQADWTPDVVPALFKSTLPEGEIGEWKQPAGGHDAYNKGDQVLFNGKTYESVIDANVWSPSAYPQGWKLV